MRFELPETISTGPWLKVGDRLKQHVASQPRIAKGDTVRISDELESWLSVVCEVEEIGDGTCLLTLEVFENCGKPAETGGLSG